MHPSKRQLGEALAPVLKEHSFRKRATTWHRALPGMFHVLHVEKSRWSTDDYTFELAIYLSALRDETTPAFYRCHIRVRLDRLVPDRREFFRITVKSFIEKLVDEELAMISDADLVAAIRRLLVAPYPVERDWDYGRPGEKYTCWTVLEHPVSNTGIAYCEIGFGPTYPWGLVWLSGEHMNIGMDSGWFAKLEGAMRESCAWDLSNPPGYEVA
jgi:hypothetical protein